MCGCVFSACYDFYKLLGGIPDPNKWYQSLVGAFRNKNSVIFETVQKSSYSKSSFEHTRSKVSTRGV